jgi:hypothetical protein
MNRSSLLSRLFQKSPRWRKVAVWASLFGGVAGGEAYAQAPPYAQAPSGQAVSPEQVFAEPPRNNFVLSPDSSGAIASNQNSWANEAGIGGMGVLGRMGHIVGPTVGRSQSITHFEAMPYAFEGNTMFYGDGRLFIANNGQMGGTAGLGMRQFLPNWNSVIGGGFFFDHDDSRDISFEQLGVSLEYLSEWLDVRTNLYGNIGHDSAKLGTSFVRGSQRFEDYRIVFDTRTQSSTATDGIDMLFTVPVIGELAQAANLEASAGWYHFEARGTKLDRIWGYRLRLDADWFASVMHTFLEFTSDRQFENNIVFGADLNYYNDIQRRPRIGHSQFNRMAEFVRRNYNVVTIDGSSLNDPSLAINPATGNPYVVTHVRNIQPPNPDFPNDPAGDGKPDTPFQTIEEARDFVVNDAYTPPGGSLADIVFVHGGSVFTDAPVVLNRDNLQILGEGVIHPLAVANAPFARARPFDPLGTIPLPTVTGGGPVPILQNNGGDAVTFAANNTTFAGFDIINTSGDAVAASGINGLTLRDVSIDGTSGVSSDGISLTNLTGNVRIENVQVSGVEGNSLVVDGGTASVNWFGGTINSTSGHSVLIEDQTGGIVNLAGDNGTNPANTFGGVTITENGGQGILIQNTQAGISFGRSSQTATGTAGVTINNSTSSGVQISNLLSPGSVSFLRGLAIDNAAAESLDLDTVTGNFLLADDLTLLTDLAIANRKDVGIDLTNIDNPATIAFLGNTDLGFVADGGTTEAAINFQNDSTGTVRFDGDLSIGDPTGAGFASINDAINIGGALPNGAGAVFQANGAVSILNSQNGASIRISSDATNVQFGSSQTPSTVTINPLAGPAIVIENTTGRIAFNSATTIGASTNSTVIVDANQGQVSFGTLNLLNSVDAGTGAAVSVTNNTNADGTASVAFGSLNINNSNGLAFLGTENDRLSTSNGTIVSTTGAALNLVDNDVLAVTLDSVTATGFAPGAFGMQVIDTRGLNEDASFRILGTTNVRGSGGLISSGIVLADGIQSRGAIFQNLQTVFLNGQDYVQNDGMAIDAENVHTFTLRGGSFDDNGQDEAEGSRHHVLLTTNVELDEDDPYIWEISNGNTFTDAVELVTNDAMVQIEGALASTGSSLQLTMAENQLRDTNGIPITPGFSANRGATNAAAVRVDWRGDLDMVYQNNWIDLNGAFFGTTGLDVIQRGTTFTNVVDYSNGNQVRGTDAVADRTTGVRMSLDGATNLTIAGNFVDLADPSPDVPGFLFNGTNATAIDLSLRTAGNNVLIDDNIIDINGDDGTGILFRTINTSNVTIGDAAVGNLPFGNSIELSNVFGSTARGVIFQTTFGTINLIGNQDNLIFLNPDNGGAFIDFQAPSASTGSILINGTPRP